MTTTSRKYYAATNRYADTYTSGFANTWDVWAFGSRKARDAFVASRNDIAARAITKRKISIYMPRRPVPFGGEYYGIDRRMTDVTYPYPSLGRVEICLSGDGWEHIW